MPRTFATYCRYVAANNIRNYPRIIVGITQLMFTVDESGGTLRVPPAWSFRFYEAACNTYAYVLHAAISGIH